MDCACNSSRDEVKEPLITTEFHMTKMLGLLEFLCFVVTGLRRLDTKHDRRAGGGSLLCMMQVRGRNSLTNARQGYGGLERVFGRS